MLRELAASSVARQWFRLDVESRGEAGIIALQIVDQLVNYWA
jgi:hypothetical protein